MDSPRLVRAGSVLGMVVTLVFVLVMRGHKQSIERNVLSVSRVGTKAIRFNTPVVHPLGLSSVASKFSFPSSSSRGFHSDFSRRGGMGRTSDRRPHRDLCKNYAAASGGDRQSDMTEPLTKEKAVKANKETADKLIGVFLEQDQDKWRHLLGFSKQWWEVANDVFDRISERAAETEDADEELRLLRLGRTLKEVHEDVMENRRVWDLLVATKPDELEAFLRENMDRVGTESFFDYMRDIVARTEHLDDVADSEKKRIKDLFHHVMDLLGDASMGIDEEVRVKMDSILNAGSTEAAKAEIDKLAESGDLDPRYLALLNKAYLTGKETWFTKEDHEETTLYMYNKMRESMAKQQPLEIRLLKYVIAFPTPRERKEALEEVLQPGVRFDDEGWFTAETTSPEAMLMRVEDLLRKYKKNVQRFGELEPRPMYREFNKRGDFDDKAIMRDLVVEAVYMKVPEVMERLREIREVIKRDFEGQLPKDIEYKETKIVTPGNDDVMFQGDNFINL